MAKQRSFYQCSECGYESAKWMGKCPNCGSWNTLTEQLPKSPAAHKSAAGLSMGNASPARPVQLREIAASRVPRKATGIGELDRVLGGGIVAGSVVLAGGEPGIGKSTLFLQMADRLAAQSGVLYISGEESAEQVAMRAERLGLHSPVRFLAETNLAVILATVEEEKPDFLIVDSIQTIYHEEIASAAGSVSQLRECAAALARMAKSTGTALFIIGHVTKDGSIAGPRVLEHLVDTVLYFEGERASSFRILRAVKNRFGSTNEIGVFDMGGSGMAEVPNPSALLIEGRQRDMPGSCIYCALEGTRPVLLEVEALVCESSFGTPRRMATGVDYNRMSLIVAVLEKKIGLKLYNQDIYVNVGGGIRVSEPALDLALAASIVSSFRNRPIRKGTVLFGEIGLTGEVRHISQADKRLSEAARMGMTRAILPCSNEKGLLTKMQVISVRTLSDALAQLF